MADDSKKPEEKARNFNPNSRESLKKAADDLLKAGRKADKANDNEKSAWASEPDASAFEYDGVTDDEDQANDIAEEIVAIQAENNDMKDRLMRLAADMENLRRRTEREVRDAKTFAIAGFARDILNVADDLRRALDHVPEDKREGADETLKNLVEGVELTERSMHSTLERHGVKKLDPEGQKFDPNFHQAMFEVPNAEVHNNTVVQVVQAGYVIGDRVLRPAMVGVSKGGPKNVRPEAADEGSGSNSEQNAEKGA